uniref:Uncharacterized protein n=1 Tax=Acrobeloides nanus TaxID=290746 RepID=A0A914EAL5_9BILA
MADEDVSAIAQQITENYSTGLVPLDDPVRKAQLAIQQSTLSEALINAGSEKLPGGKNNTISSLYQKVIKSSSSIPEFDWSKFMKQRHDAELAADISSHPNLVTAMSKAGNIFERANSNCLNSNKQQFVITKKNIRQLESFVELVLNTIRVLSSLDGAIIATLNMADMAIAATNCLKTCLERVFSEMSIW